MKKICKKLGMPMTGKKADLQARVREHILSTSMAVANPAEEEDDGDEEPIIGSVMKRVIFEGDVAVDPEFQPVAEENPTPTESIKKQLWSDSDGQVPNENKPKSSSVPPPKPPTKTPSKRMTPCKRKKSADGADMAEKENGNASTPKRTKLGFGSSSPRPLSSHNAKRTPVHMKQT